MSDRWTADTEDVLARIAHQEEAPCKPCHHLGGGADELDRATARTILTWLAGEGLLVPADAVRREERGLFVSTTGGVSPCTERCEDEGDHRPPDRIRHTVTFTTDWRVAS